MRQEQPWILAQHGALCSQGSPAGPPPPARRDPGQERGGDTLGNEAIIWYFLPEQLQIGGNYIPEGGGQGREPGDTKNLPHHLPPEVCTGLQGAMNRLLGNPSRQEGSGLGKRSDHPLTCSLNRYTTSADCVRFCAQEFGHKGNKTWILPLGSWQSSKGVRHR